MQTSEGFFSVLQIAGPYVVQLIVRVYLLELSAQLGRADLQELREGLAVWKILQETRDALLTKTNDVPDSPCQQLPKIHAAIKGGMAGRLLSIWQQARIPQHVQVGHPQ